MSAGTPEPITGDLVTPPETTIIPSTAEENASADRARGRTTMQVGIPAALVTIGAWLARLADLDLDPGTGAELPTEVTGAIVAVLTVALAFRMNPKR